jgi:S-disulfanyl-L-cysteine oxidoreductase SoxD
MRPICLRLAAVAMALGPAALPSQAAPKDTLRSTADGVFSADQATAGASVYVMSCKSCHTPDVLTATLRTVWLGKPLSEYFAFVTESMPQGAEGTLSPDEYARVVAYLLKASGMTAGANALPPDVAELRKIRIDTLARRP